MSFFGGGTSRHNTAAPGFSQAHDPFASLSGQNYDDDDGLDFDDTYDGLGDQLDESNDAFNDDTFGGGDTVTSKVGTDFDFFGHTANVSNAIEEEQLRFHRQAPVSKAAAPAPVPTNASYYYDHAPSQPVRTGYEKYKTEPVQDLEVDNSIWGLAPTKHETRPAAASTAAPSAMKKYMTLEEVEASLAKKPAPPPTEPKLQQPATRQAPEEQDFLYARPAAPAQSQQHPGYDPDRSSLAGVSQPGPGHPVTILQRPQSMATKHTPPVPTTQSSIPQHAPTVHHVQVPIQPTQILQNPNRLSADASRVAGPSRTAGPSHRGHRPQGSMSGIPQVIPQPVPILSDQEKAAHLDQETKRAKRNHKIYQLSMGNGLMTPQDKNFVTRIQLQQLVAATGYPIDHGTDSSLSEDFYYQVHSQIRGAQRQNPSQPLTNFAQTYLFQTGNRQGMRRQHRNPENHVQRMEQQVQRAVEAAKSKPKIPQLVIAGSLGKISFSNAKTPKPLLNIKRTESSAERPGSARRDHGPLDRKTVLRNIEIVYDDLMKMEDYARGAPPPSEEGNEEFDAKHREWLAGAQALNQKLWEDLKVDEKVSETALHPFIAFLSFSKGKKAMPRVFRHITFEQRTMILTQMTVHFDQLDVVRGGQVDSGDIALNAAMRENIELFSLTVLPSLFAYFNDTGLDIVAGLLGLILKLNVDALAKSRVGASMLTLLLSRSELLKQAGSGTQAHWAQWQEFFNYLFNQLEHTLPFIFPGSVNSGEDAYAWQLLAAIGACSDPEQQQRLVVAVRDRVQDTVAHAKTLPPSIAAPRLANVNLFMHSIGLDVNLL